LLLLFAGVTVTVVVVVVVVKRKRKRKKKKKKGGMRPIHGKLPSIEGVRGKNSRASLSVVEAGRANSQASQG